MSHHHDPEELLRKLRPRVSDTLGPGDIDQMITRALVSGTSPRPLVVGSWREEHPVRRWIVLGAGMCAALAALLVPSLILISEGSSGAAITPTSPLCSRATKSQVATGHCYRLPPGYVAAPKIDRRGPVPNPDPCGVAPPLGTTMTKVGGPFSAQQYNTSDAWFNEAGGNFYHVFVGNLGDDPQQGVVIVQSGPVSGICSSTVEWSLTAYPTSGRDGFLSITSSNGWILGLTATNGTSYYFDVASLAYLPR
jgi:hypothetical protein